MLPRISVTLSDPGSHDRPHATSSRLPSACVPLPPQNVPDPAALLSPKSQRASGSPAGALLQGFKSGFLGGGSPKIPKSPLIAASAVPLVEAASGLKPGFLGGGSPKTPKSPLTAASAAPPVEAASGFKPGFLGGGSPKTPKSPLTAASAVPPVEAASGFKRFDEEGVADQQRSPTRICPAVAHSGCKSSGTGLKSGFMVLSPSPSTPSCPPHPPMSTPNPPSTPEPFAEARPSSPLSCRPYTTSADQKTGVDGPSARESCTPSILAVEAPQPPQVIALFLPAFVQGIFRRMETLAVAALHGCNDGGEGSSSGGAFCLPYGGYVCIGDKDEEKLIHLVAKVDRALLILSALGQGVSGALRSPDLAMGGSEARTLATGAPDWIWGAPCDGEPGALGSGSDTFENATLCDAIAVMRKGGPTRRGIRQAYVSLSRLSGPALKCCSDLADTLARLLPGLLEDGEEWEEEEGVQPAWPVWLDSQLPDGCASSGEDPGRAGMCASPDEGQVLIGSQSLKLQPLPEWTAISGSFGANMARAAFRALATSACSREALLVSIPPPNCRCGGCGGGQDSGDSGLCNVRLSRAKPATPTVDWMEAGRMSVCFNQGCMARFRKPTSRIAEGLGLQGGVKPLWRCPGCHFASFCCEECYVLAMSHIHVPGGMDCQVLSMLSHKVSGPEAHVS